MENDFQKQKGWVVHELGCCSGEKGLCLKKINNNKKISLFCVKLSSLGALKTQTAVRAGTRNESKSFQTFESQLGCLHKVHFETMCKHLEF